MDDASRTDDALIVQSVTNVADRAAPSAIQEETETTPRRRGQEHHSRIAELDAVRGISALMVVLYHLHPREVFFGLYGLNVFFILSGFLITTIIVDRMHERDFLVNFYIRRCLRIWPIYYLTLFFLMALGALTLKGGLQLDGLPYYLTYTQFVPRYWSAEMPPFLPPYWIQHTWTLAVEEQFYVIWPVLLLVAGRRATAPLALGFVALAVWARWIGLDRWLLATQCDSLALGAMLSVGFIEHGPARRYRLGFDWMMAAIALSCVVGLVWSSYGPEPPLLVVNLLVASTIGLVLTHAGGPALEPLRSRSLCHLGLISYGFYLYHMPIFLFIGLVVSRMHLRLPWPVFDALIVGASVAAAWVSWTVIERPILALKSRFTYGRRA